MITGKEHLKDQQLRAVSNHFGAAFLRKCAGFNHLFASKPAKICTKATKIASALYQYRRFGGLLFSSILNPLFDVILSANDERNDKSRSVYQSSSGQYNCDACKHFLFLLYVGLVLLLTNISGEYHCRYNSYS